ncbi:hypothetical protein CEXT_409981 [Caerostris extrusa]|uniref:Uncharacterized protein n=1 Tax=Caerostris extrusa TaxID=172846 RepID=A0AAV4XKC4_CAEEX|nr:hypothetical protein CEXT_409981 [Caerostris extrusa]
MDLFTGSKQALSPAKFRAIPRKPDASRGNHLHELAGPEEIRENGTRINFGTIRVKFAVAGRASKGFGVFDLLSKGQARKEEEQEENRKNPEFHAWRTILIVSANRDDSIRDYLQ